MSKQSVDYSEEEVVTNVYKTETHVFKIKQDLLEKMKEGKEYLLKLGTRIQKNMKQLNDKSNGKEWQESYEAIFEEISNQKVMPGLVPQ